MPAWTWVRFDLNLYWLETYTLQINLKEEVDVTGNVNSKWNNISEHHIKGWFLKLFIQMVYWITQNKNNKIGRFKN